MARSPLVASLRAALTPALGVVAMPLFAAHYVRRGYRYCHPERSRVTQAEIDKAERSLPGLRDLAIRAADGAALRAWYTPPNNAAVVVLVTGLGGNRASLLDEAALLARRGYGSLLLEPRAHGDSDGQVATWGYLEADDVVRTVKRVYEQPGVTQVGALGFSVGASAVALAAARDASIRAVVLYATWTSLREEIASKAGRGGRLAAYWMTQGYRLSGVHVDAVHPERHMKHIAPRPLLLLAGEADSDTPLGIMDRVYAASALPKELWRLPGVGHGGYVQSDAAAYERRVIGFLDRAFAIES